MGKKKRTFILCQETALAEAASQLVVAQNLARKRNKPEELVIVAAAWMELSDRLGHGDADEPSQDVKQFGFVGVEVKDGSTEGVDEPGVHP